MAFMRWGGGFTRLRRPLAAQSNWNQVRLGPPYSSYARKNHRMVTDMAQEAAWNPIPTVQPFIRFELFEDTVRREVEQSTLNNQLALKSLPKFSTILGGLRPNEFTIFTGPTGCGKTTVLSQMSIDYACQGISVLWGSFEIKHTRLAQVMLQQSAMKPLVHDSIIDESAWKEASTKLRSLPINFMNLFGSHGLDTVLGTMELSMAHRQPPNFIILDNLQFMLSGQSSSSLDKWDLMETAVTAIRSFCNTYAVHVALVVHPRKELDDTPLGLASVSGTAKATQEADNVIILQKLGDQRYLELKKNRFTGDLGRVRIAYIPESRLVMEAPDKEAVSDDSTLT